MKENLNENSYFIYRVFHISPKVFFNSLISGIFVDVLFRGSVFKIRQNVLDWETTVLDKPTSGRYTHQSLKIPIFHHTDISPNFEHTSSEQDMRTRINLFVEK
jgi:hypothetical protein